jgi:hypothetical protein
MNAKAVSDAMAVVGTVLPQSLVAYNLFQVIWMSSHPGSTEDDYLNFLTAASQKNVDESAAILQADGFVQDEAGNWKRPT